MLQSRSNSNPGVTSNQNSRNTCVSGVFSCSKAGFSLVFSLMRSALPVETVEKEGAETRPPHAVLVLFYADNSSVRVV